MTMVAHYFAFGSLYTRNSSESFISPDEWGSDESWNFRLIRRANDGVVFTRFTAYGDMSSPRIASPLFPLCTIYTIMDARTTEGQISAETVGSTIWGWMTKNVIYYTKITNFVPFLFRVLSILKIRLCFSFIWIG